MDLTNKTKTVIRSLLISSPKSLTVNDLDRDYLKYEGHAIPFANLGYPNLKQFLLSIPDILTISYAGDIIPVASNSRSHHIHKFVTSNASTTNFNRNSFDDYYRYPRLHPRIKIEFSSRDFNHDHESNNKKSQFDVRPLRATHFIKEDTKPMKTIDDVVVPKQMENKEQKDIHRGSDECADDQSAIPFLAEDDPIHFLGLALSLSEFGVKIPSPALTEFKAGRTYDIFVTEVNRPWSFWFCLCGNLEEFKLMEEQLKMLHADDGTVTMKPFEMVAGNACLVAHKMKILRAVFLEGPVSDKVKVCFVDYGTVDVVKTSECRRMDKYFALVPKMCFPGALELDSSGVETGTKHVQRFCEMVRDKPLCGYVTQLDRKDKLVRMVLIDTSEEKRDVIINRELVAM